MRHQLSEINVPSVATPEMIVCFLENILCKKMADSHREQWRQQVSGLWLVRRHWTCTVDSQIDTGGQTHLE